MRSTRLRALVEGAVCVALAYALSFLKLDLWFQGGSIDLVMIPLIVYAYRRGAGWGLIAGAVFGTIKCFFAGGFAWGWQSVLLDYTMAYALVGLAGLFKGKKWGLPAGALAGCAARFAVHYISGVTIYKILAPTELFGATFSSPALYSLVYNLGYMLPNTILAVALVILLQKPLARIPE